MSRALFFSMLAAIAALVVSNLILVAQAQSPPLRGRCEAPSAPRPQRSPQEGYHLPGAPVEGEYEA